MLYYKTSTTLLLFIILFFSLLINVSCKINQGQLYDDELQKIKSQAKANLSSHVDEFNSYLDRPESDGPYNASNNKEFLTSNIPFLLSSNDTINKIYNYRWWMMSKHLKEYKDPTDQKSYWVVTEFFGVKPWATLSGAITCPAGHQFYDLRWLRDPKYLKGYADYYMLGSASRLNQRENDNFLTYLSRPESHHFSSWMIDGIEAYLKIHPDMVWLSEIMPGMENHQKITDSLFTVDNVNSPTHGMYKILDLYDGMEFSLSAVLGLINSDTGAYEMYKEDSWKDLYLGWGTTEKAANSDLAKQYPKAYRKGYPDLYLVRPSVNGYAFANMQSLVSLNKLLANQKPKENRVEKIDYYENKANVLQEKVLNTLWNQEDNFFNNLTAGDNEYAVDDFEARVRESVGYTPWYFNMIPVEQQEKYEKAWDYFSSEKGFYNKMGMTTAERQHPYYNEQAYAWNGRGWPFQNSVVYKAFANYLRNYKKNITANDRALLYDYIEKLTLMHHPEEPNIGEWYLPTDGEKFGGEKDYFHSTYPDIIIEDLIGFKGSHKEEFTLEPLLPEDEWDYFYFGNLRYHDHEIDIIWKKDWDEKQPGKQSMLVIWVDGQIKSETPALNQKVQLSLR